MKKILNKILPNSTWIFLRNIKFNIDTLILTFFGLNNFLSSVYYTFFSNEFSREHNAVIKGKVKYIRSLKKIDNSSAFLRRNIHRIEKGLIMKPRRNVFGEKYILETVQTLSLAIRQNKIDVEEKKWALDVLEEYFKYIVETDTILKAKNLFNCFSVSDSKDRKYIPFTYESNFNYEYSYQDLKKLFLKRKSVRWYNSKEVPFELLEKAIEIAKLAPSACNRLPYSFYISESKKSAVQIAKCAGGTFGWAENIPCIIAVIGDLSAYQGEIDRHLIYIDSSLATMQLILALETLGLSSCAINWPDRSQPEKRIKELLKLEKHQRPIMLLSVGYASMNDGIPYSKKKSNKILIKRV